MQNQIQAYHDATLLPVLSPELIKQLPFSALQALNERTKKFCKEAPLDRLTTRDLDVYLSADERKSLGETKERLVKWAQKCIQEQNCSFAMHTELHSIFRDMLKLFNKAYESKRWAEAFVTLRIPLEEGKKYLDKVELQLFGQGIKEYISNYLATGNTSPPLEYSAWLHKISRMKEREVKYKEAEKQSWIYNAQLNEEIRQFQKGLSQARKNPQAYSKKAVHDPRYSGYSLSDLLSEEEKQGCLRLIAKLISERISEKLSNFLTYEYCAFLYALPYADYTCEQIPCLDFGFEVHVVAEAKFYLKPGKVTSNGFSFDMPWIENKTEHGSYYVLLKESEFLGYGYYVFTPDELGEFGYSFWESVPLVLIQGLMEGDVEPKGCKIVEAVAGETTYEIDGYEKPIAIPDSFAHYLKEIGTWDSFIGKGIVSQKVALIVKKVIQDQGKVLPITPKSPQLLAGDDYEAVILCLKEQMGFPKAKAEEAAKYVLEKYPSASTEDKIKHAINYLSG